MLLSRCKVIAIKRHDPRFAGQTLELRFDPFDLAHLEIFLNAASIGPVRILTQTAINHIDVDGCNWGAASAPAAAHSDFLLNLRTEHARQLKREIGTLHFAKLLPPDAAASTIQE